ncbi:MAG: lytic transglycosylase domain-containing protein [Marinilabiliaceae bacterium]|nr:lytic transglycosylase domain-containing protein [Marinilabiliaceae bacterium]
MKRSVLVLSVIVIMLSSMMFLGISSTTTTESPRHSDANEMVVRLPQAPEQLDFCGERVPLERQDIKESLDRELLVTTFGHTGTILNIKRSWRYFPIIEKVLKENNVPEDFKYLVVAESSLMETAQSPAKACGLWQFIESTAKEYGLEVNNEVDERYSIVKSSQAACAYLKKAYDRLGSWTMVAASYNGGMNGISRAMSNQKQNSYYDILFGEETARYVFRILAYKVVLSNPEKYGFAFERNDDICYPLYETRTIVVDTAIRDIAQFAIDNGTTYKQVKLLNRWLRQNQLTNSRHRSYEILLPKD